MRHECDKNEKLRNKDIKEIKNRDGLWKYGMLDRLEGIEVEGQDQSGTGHWNIF